MLIDFALTLLNLKTAPPQVFSLDQYGWNGSNVMNQYIRCSYTTRQHLPLYLIHDTLYEPVFFYYNPADPDWFLEGPRAITLSQLKSFWEESYHTNLNTTHSRVFSLDPNQHVYCWYYGQREPVFFYYNPADPDCYIEGPRAMTLSQLKSFWNL